MNEQALPIGQIAPRTPGGGFGKATPIYKPVTPTQAATAENTLTDRAAGLFYEQFKQAAAACKKAGIKLRSLN